MTDRELLELAAKAAGMEVRFVGEQAQRGVKIEGSEALCWPDWSPLTDDGDALRLAVDLGLNVQIDGGTHGFTSILKHGAHLIVIEHEACADKHAATRRAIVMAAAEIGREK